MVIGGFVIICGDDFSYKYICGDRGFCCQLLARHQLPPTRYIPLSYRVKHTFRDHGLDTRCVQHWIWGVYISLAFLPLHSFFSCSSPTRIFKYLAPKKSHHTLDIFSLQYQRPLHFSRRQISISAEPRHHFSKCLTGSMPRTHRLPKISVKNS